MKVMFSFILVSLISLTSQAEENVWMRCKVLKKNKAVYDLEVVLKGSNGSAQTAEVLENGKNVFTTKIDLKESSSRKLTMFVGKEFKLDVDRFAVTPGTKNEFLSSVYYPQSDKDVSTPVLTCKTDTNLARLNAGEDWSRKLASSKSPN